MEIIVSSHIIAAALQVIGVGDVASAFNSTSSPTSLKSSFCSRSYSEPIHQLKLRCWKYFLPLFKATGHKNYSFEALYGDRGHQKRKVELRNTTTFHFQ